MAAPSWMAWAGTLLVLAAGLLADQAGVDALIWLPISAIVIFLGYRVLNPVAEEETTQVHSRHTQIENGRVDDLINIAAIADPVLLVSGGWRVLAANDSALSLLGRRIVGLDLRQTVRHPVIIDAVRLAQQGGHAVLREITALGNQDGAFRARVVPLGDTRLLISFDDITQTRLTERMRVDFVANASHELRTPLANISGFIETLLGPASEDEPARRRFLDIMAREAARMSRLIDDLLSLSRIELDKYVRPQTMLDLPPLISDVEKTLAMRLEGDGRRLLLELEADLPPVVADRDQILQVLHNLVSNSLKYGFENTPVTVFARREELPAAGGRTEMMVRVGVQDQGEGIAPEHLPRLTERFYRIDTGRSRVMGGTGLGLAIVKHIVERHRGRLDIQSRQGVGTTISFLLPTTPPAFTGEGAATGLIGSVSQNRNESVT